MVAIGGFIKLEVIWVLADIVNGLMAFPNLVGLILLSGVVVAETKKYMDHLKAREQGLPDHVNLEREVNIEEV